jgi:hypothetical protein
MACSQPVSFFDDTTNMSNTVQPLFMIFIPKKLFYSYTTDWSGDSLDIETSACTILALNSSEVSVPHLIVNRFDHRSFAQQRFQSDVGAEHIQWKNESARYEDIRSTFNQLPVSVTHQSMAAFVH